MMFTKEPKGTLLRAKHHPAARAIYAQLVVPGVNPRPIKPLGVVSDELGEAIASAVLRIHIYRGVPSEETTKSIRGREFVDSFRQPGIGRFVLGSRDGLRQTPTRKNLDFETL